MAEHGVFSVQLRSFRSVTIPMPVAQVLSDECADAVGEVAIVNLLGCVVKLVTVEVLSS